MKKEKPLTLKEIANKITFKTTALLMLDFDDTYLTQYTQMSVYPNRVTDDTVLIEDLTGRGFVLNTRGEIRAWVVVP